MNSIQLIWKHTKTTLKFIWRHFFTLVDLSLSLHSLVFHNLIWKNAFISLAVVITIDWGKQFIKTRWGSNNTSLKYNSYFGPHWVPPSQDTRIPLHIRQWWNPSVIGTAAYESNNYPRRKYE